MSRYVFCLVVLLLAACANPASDIPFPAQAAGSYRLDYSGVYGVGRVDLLLRDGRVSGLAGTAGSITYRGFYRTAADGRRVALDLIAHLPPATQQVQGVTVVGTARDVLVQFDLPQDLTPGHRWPIHIETQNGPVSGTVTRLTGP